MGTACSLVDNKSSFHFAGVQYYLWPEEKKQTSELELIGELLSVVRQEHLKLPGVFFVKNNKKIIIITVDIH